MSSCDLPLDPMADAALVGKVMGRNILIYLTASGCPYTGHMFPATYYVTSIVPTINTAYMVYHTMIL